LYVNGLPSSESECLRQESILKLSTAAGQSGFAWPVALRAASSASREKSRCTLMKTTLSVNGSPFSEKSTFDKIKTENPKQVRDDSE
jgi:hypothetical protein